MNSDALGVSGRAGAVLALALILFGCAQHARVICEPLNLASSGLFTEAVDSLDDTDVAESENDRFLYHVQRGHLLHLADRFEDSNAEFEKAAAVVRELEPWSVSETITDYTFNEAVKAYSGEDYERAYVHYYMALNYLGLGDLDGAIVECRRLDEVFRELDARYEEDTGRYQDDGFIRYLSGLLYEASGRRDDAFVDYELAVRAYEGEATSESAERMPEGLLESYVCLGRRLGRDERVASVVGRAETDCPERRSVDTGQRSEIIVVVDSGWAPYKREEALRVPIVRRHVPEDYWDRGWIEVDAVVKIALPEFESVPDGAGGFMVTAVGMPGGGAPGEPRSAIAEPVRDMDALARSTLERRRPALLARSAIRATLKTVSVLKAQHEREDAREEREKDGKGGSFWSWLADFFVEHVVPVAVSETEQADTRSWITLPCSIWMARIPAEPGEYELRLEPETGPSLPLGTVTVRAGERTFLWHRYFGTPHPMRCEAD